MITIEVILFVLHFVILYQKNQIFRSSFSKNMWQE